MFCRCTNFFRPEHQNPNLGSIEAAELSWSLSWSDSLR